MNSSLGDLSHRRFRHLPRICWAGHGQGDRLRPVFPTCRPGWTAATGSTASSATVFRPKREVTGTVAPVHGPGRCPRGNPHPFLRMGARSGPASLLATFRAARLQLPCASSMWLPRTRAARIRHIVIHFTSVDFARSMRMLDPNAGERARKRRITWCRKNGDPSYPHRRLRVLPARRRGTGAPGMAGAEPIGTAPRH